MKIALVCPYDMFHHGGGVAQVVMHLFAGLTAKGHSVKIITPRPAKFIGPPPDDYILLGTSRKVKAYLATAGDLGIEIDGSEIDAVLEREQFDVINFHEPWLPHLSRQIAQRSSSAHVGTFHANLVDSMAGKSLLNMTSLYWRAVTDKMHVFTAVSAAASGGLLNKEENNNPALKDIHYIPNGIDLARYSHSPPSAVKHPNIKTIFYVGRLEGRKGVKYLLKAYKDLCSRHADVQLFIAGKGPDETKLRDYVKDADIPRVTFLGFINDDDKIHYMHRANLFCSPAHRGESFGIVLLEAMAAGTPVVAGDNEGYASVMQETGAISLANPLDTVDFARRLELMLYDEPIRRVWKKWAKNYVKNFDWKPIVDMYEAAYEEAIMRHAKDRSTS